MQQQTEGRDTTTYASSSLNSPLSSSSSPSGVSLNYTMDHWRLSLTCLSLLVATLSLLATAVEGAEKAPASAHHYVLVHGSGHGAWCWYKVQRLLQKAGHKVTAVDLTSAGIDPTDPNTLLTFPDYNKPLIQFLSSLPANEKVVLVGHSAGGLSLAHAIHVLGPKKISAAVFAGAIMLRSGFMTPEDMAIGFPNLTEAVSLGFGQGPDKSLILTSFAFLPAFIRQVLYNKSPEEDIVLASALLKPAPAHAMQSARFNSTGVDVDGVARVYVKTMMDRVFKQEQQNAMINKWPPQKVFSVDSDHCLFSQNQSNLLTSCCRSRVSTMHQAPIINLRRKMSISM